MPPRQRRQKLIRLRVTTLYRNLITDLTPNALTKAKKSSAFTWSWVVLAVRVQSFPKAILAFSLASLHLTIHGDFGLSDCARGEVIGAMGSSGSGLTADSSVLTLTLAFLDFGLDFAQSFPFHAQPDTTQDLRVNLEGTGGSQGDHVQIPHDSPLLGGHTSDRAEGGLNLEELSILCTNLSNRVLALETSKDAQAAEILKLKTRIKKLNKRCQPVISHHRSWLGSMSRLSMKKKLGKKESISKQGRKNDKSGPKLDDGTFDDLDADLAHGMDDMDIEEAVNEESGEKGGSTVSTARPEVSTARKEIGTADPTTPPTTTTIFDDKEMTLADTLVKMKDNKAKGVVFKDTEELVRPVRSVLTLKPLTSIDLKYKGKGVLEEPEPAKKMTRSDFDAAQVAKDAELLAEFFERRKKQLAEERAATIRNKPPTRTQLRSLMMTYLKHTERVANFVPIGSEEDERLIQKMNKKAASVHVEKVLEEPDSTKVEVKQEAAEQGTRKTPGKVLKMKGRKKRKGVPDEEGEVNYEVLEKRYPIVDWESKFYHTDRYGKPHDYYRVFRVDGSLRYIKTFTEMVSRFDRKYLLKETLKRMMSLKLIAESASDGAYNLIRFIQKHIDEFGSHDGYEKVLQVKELASPKQMAVGKDFSNPLIVDSLLKTIWLSMHHVIAMKHWLFQSKRLLVKKSVYGW
ncbi:hypothetical protein Tco_1568032 [Tanacetum coccineum]